jgi:ERCC4-type nuclease
VYAVGGRTAKTYTAKCAANQALIDVLAQKRESTQLNVNVGHVYRKAMEAMAAVRTPITTFAEATALKGIGPTVARTLGFSKSFTIRSGTDKENDSVASSTTQTRKAKRKAPPSRWPGIHERQAAPALATRKEVAYRKAVQESATHVGRGLHWRLVLLIDQREVKAQHYSSKAQQSGIPTEIRALPIGDMCWIAQGWRPSSSDTTSSHHHKTPPVVAELLLGTIVERKQVSDLKSSLFGTRYDEQQLRLAESGQPQVIFLIEGDTRRDLVHCPAETLHSTMWNIRIDKGNQVIHTAHAAETVQTLRRMHRRMLQRTFPFAFYGSTALPAFGVPTVTASTSSRRDSFGEQHKKRRRRLSSLHGLVFDQDPVPMAGMARFVSYKELKAKVERDREACRRTVGSIHQAMLKQVSSISDTRVLAISAEYPTAHALLAAYDEVDSPGGGKRLLRDLPVSSRGTAISQTTLGPKSAAELYIAYGLGDETAQASSTATTNVVNVARAKALPIPQNTTLLHTVVVRRPDDSSPRAASVPPHCTGGTLPTFVGAAALNSGADHPKSRKAAPATSSVSMAASRKVAAKPIHSQDVVDLLSSDEDEVVPTVAVAKRRPSFSSDSRSPPVATKPVFESSPDTSTVSAALPSSKRRYSSISSASLSPVTDKPAFNSSTETSDPPAASQSGLRLSVLESSDDDLDDLLGPGASRKAPNVDAAIEVIEID